MLRFREQWRSFPLGPRSRDVLRKLVDEKYDLADRAFPYLAAKEIAVGGVNARLFRLSFSGEMAYELAVPARYGDAAIRAIMAAGEEFSIAPYGTEALGVMRIEKGHVAGNVFTVTDRARSGFGRYFEKEGLVAAHGGAPACLADRPALVVLRPIDALRACARAPFPSGRCCHRSRRPGPYESCVLAVLGHGSRGPFARAASHRRTRCVAYYPVRNAM